MASREAFSEQVVLELMQVSKITDPKLKSREVRNWLKKYLLFEELVCSKWTRSVCKEMIHALIRISDITNPRTVRRGIKLCLRFFELGCYGDSDAGSLRIDIINLIRRNHPQQAHV